MDSKRSVDDIPVSRHEAARLIGVSLRTLDTLVHEGKISFLRVRGRVLFYPSDLRAYLDSCRVGV